MPNTKPKTKPRLTISFSSLSPTDSKTLLASSGLASMWRMTMSLGSRRSSMLSPIASTTSGMTSGSCSSTRRWMRARIHRRVDDLGDDLGQLLLHAPVDARAQPPRQGAPELRAPAHHHALDELVDLLARRCEHVLGERLAVELVVEVAPAADLGDPLVDRDAAHLGRARGDDPLPADAPDHDARDLLHPARQELGQRRQAGQPEAAEAQRMEEHPHARPVRRI